MAHRLFFVFGYFSLSIVLTACLDRTATRQTEISAPISNETLQQHLLQGWNTWKNPSFASQVLMPDGLGISLKFRNTRGGPYWMDDVYISSKNKGNQEIQEPGLHTYDGSYTEIVFTWQGQKAAIRTATDGDDLILEYQPQAPEKRRYMMAWQVGYLWNKPGTVEKKGQQIIANSPNRQVVFRVATPENSEKLPLNSPYFSFWSDEPVLIYTGRERTETELHALLDQKHREAKQQAQTFGELAEVYEAIQTLHAWNTIYDARNDRVIVPVDRVWNEVWGGYVLFDWDTYFSAVMLALDNKELAFSNAIAITDEITEGGFIPNVATGYDRSNDRSQPPVGSVSCKLIYDRWPEKWFLEEVYDNLLTWNRWWPKERDYNGYLCWGSDPHPNGLEGGNKQGAKWESGLDNSPLFEEAVYNEQTHLLNLASVDLMSLYVADCKALADIADVLGKTQDAAELRARGEKYAAKLNELWDEKSGIYRDKFTDTGEFSQHLAPTNFYPLLAGVPTQQQAERMINEHFFNEQEFFGEWIMPSIARNDPAFPDNSYWRGRIWAPMNFLVYLGLRNYNLPDARKVLVEKSKNLLLKSWREERRVYENYNSNNGVGGDVRNSSSFYSWGGLLGFIALMEDGYFDNQNRDK